MSKPYFLKPGLFPFKTRQSPPPVAIKFNTRVLRKVRTRPGCQDPSIPGKSPQPHTTLIKNPSSIMSVTNSPKARHQYSQLDCNVTLPEMLKTEVNIPAHRREAPQHSSRSSARSCRSSKSRASFKSSASHKPADLMRETCPQFRNLHSKDSVYRNTDRGANTEPQSLESRIDTAIRARVALLLDIKKTGPREYQLAKQLNQELAGLAESVRALGDAVGSDVQQKLAFIEKLISEKNAESQILKEFYHLFACKRTEYSRMNSTSQEKSFKATLKMLDRIEKQASCSNLTSSSYNKLNASRISYKSLAQDSFKVPPRSAYDIYKYQQPKYLHKRQVLPGSNYKENYLNYSGVLVYQHPLSQDKLPPAHYSSSLSSTYKKDFTNKKADNIPISQLDATKDKFRALKLTYNKRKDSSAVHPSKMARTIAALERQYSIRQIPDPLKTNACQGHFLSTSQSDFKGGANLVPSYIKDKRLNSWKTAFKFNLIR